MLKRDPELTTLGRSMGTTGQVLESCALLAVRTNDIPAFSRFYSQLEPFYALSRSHSTLRPRIVSLLLLSHLSQNRIGGFHTVLEKLASANDEVLTSSEVAYTTELETALMEGSFAKIWRKREEMPSKDYIALLDTLMNTVRSVPSPNTYLSATQVFKLSAVAETRSHRVQRKLMHSYPFKTLRRFSSSPA